MNDPRVAFFEPLKLVAKMRNERRKYRNELNKPADVVNPEERLLLLRVDDAGHGGNSGQYSYLEVRSLL
jgi:oligopeptidase B